MVVLGVQPTHDVIITTYQYENEMGASLLHYIYKIV